MVREQQITASGKNPMTPLSPNCRRQLFYRAALLLLCGLSLPVLSGCAPKGQVIDERALFDMSAEFYSDGACQYTINGVSSRDIGPQRRAKDSMIGFYEEKIVIYDICFPDSAPLFTVSSEDTDRKFGKLMGKMHRQKEYVDGPPETTKMFPIKSRSKHKEFRVQVDIGVTKELLEHYQLKHFTKYSKRIFYCNQAIEMVEGTLIYFGKEERSRTNLDYSLSGKARIFNGGCP